MSRIIPADRFKNASLVAIQEYKRQLVQRVIRGANDEVQKVLQALESSPKTTMQSFPNTTAVFTSVAKDETLEIFKLAGKEFLDAGYHVEIGETDDCDDGPGRYSAGYRFLKITVR